MSNQELKNMATQIRRDIVRMVHQVNSGHPGGSLGCTELFTTLFFKAMKFKPAPFNKSGEGEDMFFLSNGHISPVYYSALARAGYFPISELATFRKINSRLQGHPTNHEGLPGVRVASGSLGQGLSVASGAALAKKMKGDENWVFALTGDGELQEGQVWEAFLFAAHNKLDNVIAFIDHNNQQIDGKVQDVLSLGNLKQKLSAFSWEVLEIDGHNFDTLISAIEVAKQKAKTAQKPVAIILQTIMGKGIDFMENDHKWHGTAPNDEQLSKALSQLHLENINDY